MPDDAREIIQRLVDAGVDPVEAGAIIAEAMLLGSREAKPYRTPGAERQARYRERQKKASQTVTKRNDVTESDACDGGAEKSPPHTPPIKTTPPQNTTCSFPPKRGTRLPDDWLPSPQLLEWANAEGISQHTVQFETDRFTDYWPAVPGSKGVKLCWDRTWRNWMRKAKNDGKARSAHDSRSEGLAKFREQTARNFEEMFGSSFQVAIDSGG